MIADLLAYPFMVNALVTGTIVAMTAPVLGWLVVLRRQAFTAHTLGVLAFPGAAGAVFVGLPSVFGYYAGALSGALVLGRGHTPEQDSARTGVVHAAALAAGVLLGRLYSGMLPQTTSLLFGSFLGISPAQVLLTGVVAGAVLTALAAMWRPLTLVSHDRDLARARGLPVSVLDAVATGLVALTVASASGVTGSLLIFALLVTPAAAAQSLTSRAAVGIPIAVAAAVLVTWASLVAAFVTDVPPGGYLAAGSFAVYVAAVVAARARRASR